MKVGMRCRKFRRLVVIAETHELSEGDQLRLKKHEAHCSRCGQFSREMQAVHTLLRMEHTVESPSAFKQTVMAKLRSGDKQGISQRIGRKAVHRAPSPVLGWREALVALGVMVVLLAGGLLALTRSPGYSSPAEYGILAVGATPLVAVWRSEDQAGTSLQPLEQLLLAHRSYLRQRSFNSDLGIELVSFDLPEVGGSSGGE